ncbi:MAG: winged helix-turn-helix transcriptional regulator [Rhodospirillaceae bacterium]|nr:winged helix-turn-helix transcriptional regulator [Rhodospirillaceae bacterium]MYB15021.1 winged helix-turn-helix transcriptional regulator [Rhodospirillaceae bacterium]MYI47930.1 winged helix-turn-helix transcriptional regulator [Rhodospirillaceae bacterium]
MLCPGPMNAADSLNDAAPAPSETGPAAPGSAAGRDAVDLGRLAGLLGYHLRRAEVFAFQNFAAHLGADGIGPGQLGVLLLVQANPGSNQTRIGRALGIDRSTLVSIVDALEARGLVRREPSPTDRRSHALVLTADGGAFLRAIRPRLDAHEAEIARGLTPAERAQLIDMLQRLAAP